MILVWLAITVATKVEDEQLSSVEKDLALLQGTWEMSLMREGVQIRVVKEVKNNRETVSTFRNGNLIHEHAVDFSLEHSKNVRIFRWKNGMISAGPRKGQPMPDGVFIYRLRENEWTAVHGMLENDTGPLITERYRRPQ